METPQGKHKVEYTTTLDDGTKGKFTQFLTQERQIVTNRQQNAAEPPCFQGF